jgi:hypothetical protein
VLCVQVDRTRQRLTATLADKAHMVSVVVDGRRGYRFSGRLRLDGLLLTGEGLETRHPVVAQRDLTARACSLDIDFEGVSLAA